MSNLGSAGVRAGQRQRTKQTVCEDDAPSGDLNRIEADGSRSACGPRLDQTQVKSYSPHVPSLSAR